MRRRSHTDNDLKLFNTIASKGYALGTDFIVAHPGESEEMWQEALRNFKEFPLTHIHAFIFSPRNNTHSATMKDVINGTLAKERLNTLKSIVEKNNYEFRKKIKFRLKFWWKIKKMVFLRGMISFLTRSKLKVIKI